MAEVAEALASLAMLDPAEATLLVIELAFDVASEARLEAALVTLD